MHKKALLTFIIASCFLSTAHGLRCPQHPNRMGRATYLYAYIDKPPGYDQRSLVCAYEIDGAEKKFNAGALDPNCHFFDDSTDGPNFCGRSRHDCVVVCHDHQSIFDT